eukprot:SAG31_NODE_1361_length_8631_cov_3.401899_5_plen_779_part_00
MALAAAAHSIATPCQLRRPKLCLAEKLLGGASPSPVQGGPSPHAVSPLLSPSPTIGGESSWPTKRPPTATEHTPQLRYARVSACSHHDPATNSPWKENWTDELFSVDIALPSGFDIATITGLEAAARTGQVEVDTGTVITVESRERITCPLDKSILKVAASEHQSRQESSDFSLVICGDDEQNVEEAALRIEGLLSEIGPADAEISVRSSAGTVRDLKLGDLSAVEIDTSFDQELRLMQQEEEQSAKLAHELQLQEEHLALSLRDEERANAKLAKLLQLEEEAQERRCRMESELAGEKLALQLQSEEDAQEKSRIESLELSDAFFEQLPAGYAKCPGCEVAFEMVIDTATATAGGHIGAQELPRGATLDTVGAERHKSQCRFRCFNCTDEFCSGCGAQPYHFGFDCAGWAEHLNSRHCRFCGDVAASNEDCCNNEDCRRYLTIACNDVLPCGHLSNGVKSDKLPCLEPACAQLRNDGSATADDWCMICYVAPLRAAPSIMLGCGHVFHAECMQERISIGRPGPRLSFNFLDCPACNIRIDVDRTPFLAAQITPHLRTEAHVKKKALQRWKETGRRACQVCHREVSASSSGYKQQCCDSKECQAALKEPSRRSSATVNKNTDAKVVALAMRRFNYYPCSRCDSVFFGGEAECGDRPLALGDVGPNEGEDQQAEEQQQFDADELVCGACSSTGESKCSVHGVEFVEYKCRFCCKRGNVATFFCGGSTHFCSECHKKGWGATAQPCDPESCMFNGDHPPGAVNGKDEFSLGCGLCRNQMDR